MKKLITLLISILMIFTLLPGKAIKAYDDDDYIVVTNVPVSYDEAAARGSTKLREYQVMQALSRCVTDSYPAEGVMIGYGDAYLMTKYNDGYRMLSGSSSYMDKSEEYYLCILVSLDPGYRFPETGFPNVTLNGKAPDDMEYWYDEAVLAVYKKIEVTDDDMVLAVWLNPESKKVQTGTDFQFRDYVIGTDPEVTWSLNGNTSSNTTVENGLVKVSEDEDAFFFTVTATSVLDPSRSASSKVYVSWQELRIDSVTVEPAEHEMVAGQSYQFYAIVEGNDDHDVTWKLMDTNGRDHSGASYVDDSGMVYLSEYEKEKQLIVRAMSSYHSSVYGDAVITIVDPDPVRNVAVVYDQSKVPLNTSVSGKDVRNALQKAIQKDAGKEAWVDAPYCYLVERVADYWIILEESESKLNLNAEYYIKFNIEEKTGYCFDEDALPNVTVNGEKAEIVEMGEEGTLGWIYAYKRVYLDSGDTPTPTPAEIIRLAGQNRYITSMEVGNELLRQMSAQTGALQFEAIIIATGENFADALAGGYLAAKKGAPIILIKPKVAEQVVNWINVRLVDNGTVYVLGGEGAVPENCLAGLKVTPKRLAGKTRYITNLLILEEAGVTNEDILICTGENYADSLSASSTGRPMLLVNAKKKTLNDDQKAFLQAHSSNNFYIIGGTGAVPEEIEAQVAQIKTPKRLSGKGRYQTSVAIAEEFFKNPKYAVLAYAQNYPDGLSGGPLAYVLNAPILLTKAGSESAARDYCTAHNIKKGYICGGTGVISDETAQIIFSGN